MRRRLNIFLLIALHVLLVNLGGFAIAATDPASKVLVLYKERDPDHEAIVKLLTGFLEQAGYEYDTSDVEALLVQKPDMRSYSGIMTCFQTSQMVNGDLYPHWLVEQMEAGRRVLIVGSYGAYQAMIRNPDGSFVVWNESTRTINTFFYPFGLEFYFAFTSDSSKIRLLKADKEYAQYEAPITSTDLDYYQLFKSVNSENRIFLELERTDMMDSRSALNVITPFGGMVIAGYAYYWDPVKKKTVLRVNFPEIMKEVFSAESPEVDKYTIKSHSELIRENPLPERSPPTPPPGLRPSEISRRVLVPYKKSEVRTIEDSPLYKRAAVVLEYLGMVPLYWAVEDGLPDDETMADFRGVVTWHTRPHMYRARKYGEWLLRQVRKGKRVVILQEYGASYDLQTQAPVSNEAEVFEALGIRFVARKDKRIEHLPELRLLDKEMMGFERDFDPALVTYDHTYTSGDGRNRVFLSYSDREFGTVDLGVVTANGGICMGETPFYYPHYNAERIGVVRKALRGEVAPEVAEKPQIGAWVLNPYRFFSEALGLKGLPAPDITTLNGSRIFYAHIDGDGLDSPSLIDGVHSAGYFISEQLLKHYSEIPTTVSVITKFIEGAGNKYYHPTATLVREIFELPNVDVAVHAATHPYDWVEGDPYIKNPGDYPYEIGYKPHDLVQEIWGAKLFVDHNLTRGDKKAETIFWSGATNPGVEALGITWRTGMHNLNGGDPRYDDEYPSMAGVSPYSHAKGPYRQYFTSAQNDYIYTLFLTGDWGGQRKVLEHYDRTDKPHRFYPMNLYYHFYSGIKKESLEALRHVYDYVRSLDAAPIFATEYLEVVEDYYNTRVGYDGKTYWVENNGFLRTVRFDGKVHVDMEKSKGVIGYSYYNDQTYVHLDGSRRREVVLSESAPTMPYFVQATQFVDKASFDGSQFDFDYRGFGKALLRIGGLDPGAQYQLSLEAPGRKPLKALVRASRQGVLEYRAQLAAPPTTYKGILKR